MKVLLGALICATVLVGQFGKFITIGDVTFTTMEFRSDGLKSVPGNPMPYMPTDPKWDGILVFAKSKKPEANRFDITLTFVRDGEKIVRTGTAYKPSNGDWAAGIVPTGHPIPTVADVNVEEAKSLSKVSAEGVELR